MRSAIVDKMGMSAASAEKCRRVNTALTSVMEACGWISKSGGPDRLIENIKDIPLLASVVAKAFECKHGSSQGGIGYRQINPPSYQPELTIKNRAQAAGKPEIADRYETQLGQLGAIHRNSQRKLTEDMAGLRQQLAELQIVQNKMSASQAADKSRLTARFNQEINQVEGTLAEQTKARRERERKEAEQAEQAILLSKISRQEETNKKYDF